MTSESMLESPQETPTPTKPAPSKPRRRRLLWVLGALGMLVILWLFFIGSVELLHYTESAAFCSSCHVMHPENTAYESSPHARAECGTCHIGPGAMAAFQAKLANVRYLWVYPTNNYERPIPSPITSLRPVEVVCEQCHWPEKFYEDRMAVVSDYGTDEQNSLTSTALLMKTGGGTEEAGLGRGIHWHIANPVYYIATDEKRQDIPWVQAEYSGTVTEYLAVDSTLTPEDIASAEKRKMDCIDCHNRASHDFRRPNDSIDEAMAAGLIAADLPAIKQKGVEVLETVYATEEEAAVAIAAVADFYKETYPDVYSTRQGDVDQAVAQLQAIFDRTTFPFMNVTWQSHTNNIGHKDFPGCFRCHDGKHLSQSNEAIRLECNICHGIPQVALPGQPAPVVSAWPPENEPEAHRSTTWLAEHRYQFDSTCAECHTVSDPGGVSNVSFCSNSACHGTEWVYAGLNAPRIAELSAPPKVPGTGLPEPVPHPVEASMNCATCHGSAGVHPMPADSHAGFDQTICTQCHQSSTPAGSAPGASPPKILHPVEGRADCQVCHGANAVKPSPANHTDFTTDMCQMCHQLGEVAPQNAIGPGIPHAIAGLEDQCLACHDSDSVKPFPAHHEGFTAGMCQMCHQPGEVTSQSAIGPDISHSIEGQENQCTVCHASDSIKPFPANHEGFSNAVCQMCHQVDEATLNIESSGTSTTTVSPAPQGSIGPGIPHSIEGRENQCLACHYTGSIEPFPADHEGFTNQMCGTCHQLED